MKKLLKYICPLILVIGVFTPFTYTNVNAANSEDGYSYTVQYRLGGAMYTCGGTDGTTCSIGGLSDSMPVIVTVNLSEYMKASNTYNIYPTFTTNGFSVAKIFVNAYKQNGSYDQFELSYTQTTTKTQIKAYGNIKSSNEYDIVRLTFWIYGSNSNNTLEFKLKEIKNTENDASSELLSNMNGILNTINSTIKSLLNTTNATLSNIYDNLTNVISIQIDNVKSSIYSLTSDVNSGITNIIDSITSKMESVKNYIYSGILQVHDKLHSMQFEILNRMDSYFSTNKTFNNNEQLVDKKNEYNNIESGLVTDFENSFNQIELNNGLLGNNDFIKTSTFVATQMTNLYNSNDVIKNLITYSMIIGLAMTVVGISLRR